MNKNQTKKELKSKEPKDTVIVDESEDETNEVIPFKYSITSYGADYTVDGLVKKITEGDIYVPSFQRGFVWSLRQASRFIESLLLGLPVPGIFLSKEQETQKLLVIDGQQRLFTLKYFYGGAFHRSGREFALEGVQLDFDGVTYKSLKDQDRRRLDNSVLHATIVQQDKPSDDKSSIYHIFERLNTGGVLLQSQEIRACIYRGKFNDLLKELNNNEYWHYLFGNPHSRMRDQEMILRFLAFYYDSQKYRRPIKGFLNTFMSGNRNLKKYPKEEIVKIFVETIKVIHSVIGPETFKPKKRFLAALFDAIMVGVARRLNRGEIKDTVKLKEQYRLLLENSDFQDAILTHTSDEVTVKTRLGMAEEAFSRVE